jgi:hypothetical protein
MSLTPPRLRRGSVPAQEFTHGGHGGSEAAPPKPPSRIEFHPLRVRVHRSVVYTKLNGSHVHSSQTLFESPLESIRRDPFA